VSGPTLVVLAAGLGSRYGGVKQMDAIGAGGETLLDYAVHDALRAGFSDVVFLIRSAIEADFRATVLSRMGGAVPWTLAFQELDSLIPPTALAAARAVGRTKPWGTAHALLCAAGALRGPFAAINADDFYGRSAFFAMEDFLKGLAERAEVPAGGPAEAALVPYRLDRTLSPSGTVARGVCRIEAGKLRAVEERTAIVRREGRIVSEGSGGAPEELAGDTPVSMNIWGFSPSALPGIDSYFRDFLDKRAGDPKAEAYLPSAVGALIASGALSVSALEADSEWFGMTYREDREEASRRIRDLVAAGDYPRKLWG
jgi:hypothetical protein